MQKFLQTFWRQMASLKNRTEDGSLSRFWFLRRTGVGFLSRFWFLRAARAGKPRPYGKAQVACVGDAFSIPHGLRGLSCARVRALYIASLGLGLLLSFGITAVQGQLAFANTCADIRADTLRLHIVANSDSVADQSAKLAVRDAILTVMDEVYQEALQAAASETAASLTLAQSTALVLQNMPRFALAASEALAGSDSATQSGTLAAGTPQITLRIITEYFDTTVYDTFTLPAGYYTALRVEIGAAAGQNWWCVLSPALCLASASGTYDTVAENEIICGDYALRFAALEWWENCALRSQLKS